MKFNAFTILSANLANVLASIPEPGFLLHQYIKYDSESGCSQTYTSTSWCITTTVFVNSTQPAETTILEPISSPVPALSILATEPPADNRAGNATISETYIPAVPTTSIVEPVSQSAIANSTIEPVPFPPLNTTAPIPVPLNTTQPVASSTNYPTLVAQTAPAVANGAAGLVLSGGLVVACLIL